MLLRTEDGGLAWQEVRACTPQLARPGAHAQLAAQKYCVLDCDDQVLSLATESEVRPVAAGAGGARDA